MKIRKWQPRVEALESRWVPALLLTLDGAGNLTGIFGNGWDDVELEFTADDEVEVLEDGASLGVYSVPGNLRVALGNTAAATPSLTVDFATNAASMSGSLTVTLGNTVATATVALLGDADIVEIGGNLSVKTGAGSSGNAVTDVDVAGSAVVDPGFGGDGITMTDSDVAGNLTLGNAGAVYDGGTVGGNLRFRANDGLGNTLVLGADATVEGSLIYTGTQTAADFLEIDGAVLGNVIMTSGASDSTLDLSDTDASVLGNVHYNGGGGVDALTIGATIGGSVTASLGSGDDTVDFDGAVVLGSAINIIGGNGDDTLTNVDLTAPGARLTFLGGNGDDTVDWSAANPVLASAYLDGGFGVNDFIPDGTIDFPFTLRNFV